MWQPVMAALKSIFGHVRIFVQTICMSDLTCCSGGFISMKVLKDVLQSTDANLD